MYDLAARVQDLLQFRFNSFTLDGAGGGKHQWIAKKTKGERKGYLSPVTMQLLKEV